MGPKSWSVFPWQAFQARCYLTLTYCAHSLVTKKMNCCEYSISCLPCFVQCCWNKWEQSTNALCLCVFVFVTVDRPGTQTGDLKLWGSVGSTTLLPLPLEKVIAVIKCFGWKDNNEPLVCEILLFSLGLLRYVITPAASRITRKFLIVTFRKNCDNI